MRPTNFEMIFAPTKIRFLIILVILIGTSIYFYIDDDGGEFNDKNSLLPAGEFNESVMASLDNWWEKMFCYKKIANEEAKIMLKEFLVDVNPQNDEFKNIYMIEDNCKSVLSWRMWCSAESVARANVNASLFIITVANYLTNKRQVLSRWLEEYPNIVPVKINLNRLLHNTPLQRFSTLKAWTKVPGFMHAHVSDAMRLALVWRSGGTYYDSDIIVIRSLPEEDNVFMLESYFRLVNAFVKTKKHHPLLNMSLEYFSAHYNKRRWDYNGPELLSNLTESYCRVKELLPGTCKDLTILDPSEGIQPIHWKDIKYLFKEIKRPSKINDTFLRKAHGVHFNNHLTSSQEIHFEADTLFNRLMQEYCPFTYYEWKKETRKLS